MEANTQTKDGGRVPAQPQGDREWDETLFTPNWDKQTEKFEDMGLKEDLLRGIFGYCFETPFGIQQTAIEALILGKDIIAHAQPGSGKTAAFAIGMLQTVDHNDSKTQALVLAATGELAKQIHDVVSAVGSFLGTKVLLLVDEAEVNKSKLGPGEGCQVVVGTPAQVNDLMKQGNLPSECLKMLVVDGADEMLGLGLLDPIQEVMKNSPAQCQMALFSATISGEVMKLAESVRNDPVKIVVKKESLSLDRVKQYFLLCEGEEVRPYILIDILKKMEMGQFLVYVNTVEAGQRLAEIMTHSGFQPRFIHERLEQEVRNSTVLKFRNGALRFLITTDFPGRVTGVYRVGLVINFQFPSQREAYVHRISRSGRYGRRGNVINFVSLSDQLGEDREVLQHRDLGSAL